MTEKTIASEKAVQSQAQGYLDHYWKEIGAPDDLGGISTYDKKIMHDVPLQLLLQPLEVPKNPETNRDKLVKFFVENNWLPQTRQEAMIAGLKGVDETIYRASRTRVGRPEGALKSVHRSVEAYLKDSQNDKRTLRSVRTPLENFDIDLDVNLLRSNNEALYLLGDHLLSREFLEQGNWLNSSWRKEFNSRQKYWRGFMLAAAKDASDDVLYELFNNTLTMAEERSDYWKKQHKYVNGRLGHLVVSDVAKPAEPAEADPEIKDDKPASKTDGESFSTANYIFEDHREWLEERHRQYAERVEDMDHDGMPQAEKQAILEREFPEFISVERSDYLDTKATLAASRAAALAGGSHAEGPRGKKYHFDNDNARVNSDRDQA